MSEQVNCPSCNAKINVTAQKCPNCKKILVITNWEIELDNGEKSLYFGEKAIVNIREHLVSGKIRLANRCRQYTSVLEKVIDGNDQYTTKAESEWKSLLDYADNVFTLQVLYDPVKAYGKQAAKTTWGIVGVIVAIAWYANLFLSVGANPLAAIVVSIILLLLTPTVIGLGIAAAIAAAMFNLSGVAIVIRSLISILIGVLAGGITGWTIGYLIGITIGSTKKKVIEG